MRLAKGTVSRAVQADLDRVMGSLHLDLDLDVLATVTVLLAVALEVCVRFDEYKRWPFQAWRLCRQYSPDGYGAFCMSFLSLPDELLDFGFGLLVRKLALESGSELTGMRYIMSEGCRRR